LNVLLFCLDDVIQFESPKWCWWGSGVGGGGGGRSLDIASRTNRAIHSRLSFADVFELFIEIFCWIKLFSLKSILNQKKI